MAHWRTVVLSVFVVCMLSMACGCKTAQHLTSGTGECLKEDAVDTYAVVKNVDKWIKDNLW